MTRVRSAVFMPPRSAFEQFERNSMQRMQAAALNATATAARNAKTKLRGEMAGAQLGRLGNAIDDGSDAEKNGVVHQVGRNWSASGWIFARSKSQRTLGTLESYLEGSEIVPRRGRYLWIATDDVKRLVGVPTGRIGGKGRSNVRLEPYLWDRTYGLKLGPLTPITSASGTPLLIIKNATLSMSGKRGSARPLTKRGKVPKGQVAVDFIVAFIGISSTSRKARVDARAIVKEAQASLPELIEKELNRR